MHPHIVRVDLRKGNRKCRHWLSQPMLLSCADLCIGGAVSDQQGPGCHDNCQKHSVVLLTSPPFSPLSSAGTPPSGATDTTPESAGKTSKRT